RRWRLLLHGIVAVGVAGLAFTPWYFGHAAIWREAVTIAQARGNIGFREVAMLFREMPGAGYIGGGLLLLGVVFCLARTSPRLLWGLYAAVPIVCVVAADAWFGYYLAVRQLIVVLAPLALLFAAALERMEPRAGIALAAAMTVALIAGDVSFFRRPRENWQAA